MASPSKPGDPFIYYIPLPLLGRLLALVFPVVHSAFFIRDFLPVANFSSILISMRSEPMISLLSIVNLAVILALVLMAIDPLPWRARLEFTSGTVKLTPNTYMRQFGDRETEIPISPDAQEILICRGSQDTRSPLDSRSYSRGFRVIIRASNGKERTLAIETGEPLSIRQSRMLESGIARATGLPVRLVAHESRPGNNKTEVPWTPKRRFA